MEAHERADLADLSIVPRSVELSSLPDWWRWRWLHSVRLLSEWMTIGAEEGIRTTTTSMLSAGDEVRGSPTGGCVRSALIQEVPLAELFWIAAYVGLKPMLDRHRY